MIDFYFFFTIITAHYIGDFLLQTHWMATNKSSRIDALMIHSFVYILPFSLLMLILPWEFVLWYMLINMLFHATVDVITSNITKSLWEQNKFGTFFKVIGTDQYLHYLILCVTYLYMTARISI